MRSRHLGWIVSSNMCEGSVIGFCGRSHGSYGGRRERSWNAPLGAYAGSTPISRSSLLPLCDPELFTFLARPLGSPFSLESINVCCCTHTNQHKSRKKFRNHSELCGGLHPDSLSKLEMESSKQQQTFIDSKPKDERRGWAKHGQSIQLHKATLDMLDL